MGVTVVVVEFGVMRCQPLRRALCEFCEQQRDW
ncbi:acetyltransferase [Vibrio cholerae]|nr:acetyltransferase [Vibrio cholerae]TXZ00487.1 acetyltransferase [Vibrio cholerae]